MIPSFVKKFDFRGEYEKDIYDKDAFYIGLAVEKTIPLKKVLIGWDSRESSKNLALNFISALQNKGIEISYIPICPIDYITSCANAFDFDFSVMFTGSHNPWTWTGLLMHTKGGESVEGERVHEIIENYNKCLSEPYLFEPIDLTHHIDFGTQAEKNYADKIKSLIPIEKIKELSVLVDLGDGTGSRSLTLIESLVPQVKFGRIHDRNLYDANSTHIADPSDSNNMQDLIFRVRDGDYDCGFAFDSDADRMLALDENGEYLNGSLLGSAHVSVLTSLGFTDKSFGYAVDCGLSLPNCLSQIENSSEKNFFMIPIPIGRSIVRDMIRGGKIDFGVENVGHFYLKDFFMTDSAVFSMIVILYWISQNGALSTLKTSFPDGFSGRVFMKALSDQATKDLVEKINLHFAGIESKKITVDGVRYEYYTDGLLQAWFTIRHSGYEAISKCYFGALNEETFYFLKEKFSTFIKD